MHAGRVEFTSFLPEATQGVVVQPVGKDGVLIAATDTVRGFGRLDQVRVQRMRVHGSAVLGLSVPTNTCVVLARACLLGQNVASGVTPNRCLNQGQLWEQDDNSGSM